MLLNETQNDKCLTVSIYNMHTFTATMDSSKNTKVDIHTHEYLPTDSEQNMARANDTIIV